MKELLINLKTGRAERHCVENTNLNNNKVAPMAGYLLTRCPSGFGPPGTNQLAGMYLPPPVQFKSAVTPALHILSKNIDSYNSDMEYVTADF